MFYTNVHHRAVPGHVYMRPHSSRHLSRILHEEHRRNIQGQWCVWQGQRSIIISGVIGSEVNHQWCYRVRGQSLSVVWQGQRSIIISFVTGSEVNYYQWCDRVRGQSLSVDNWDRVMGSILLYQDCESWSIKFAIRYIQLLLQCVSLAEHKVGCRQSKLPNGWPVLVNKSF